MMITRGGFLQIVGNAFAGLGFPAEGPSVYEFPIVMFDSGSDLTPINENIDKIVYGLTKWEPSIKEKGVVTPPKVTVTPGKDYPEAVDNMSHLFLQNMWSDGLPVQPATDERVNWILTGTDLPRDTTVGTGRVLPRGGIATVESLAVALAMAGGRPEYLPVLIATLETINDPAGDPQSWQATTCAVYPAMILNGPVARQIRVNSGYGCLGPDPKNPAGASIGRAVRLILQDLGGAVPGIGTMSIYGGPARYTNIVFAEDEGGIPDGWKPLNVELGFPAGSNTVTMITVSGTTNFFLAYGAPTAEEEESQYLHQMAAYMRIPNTNYGWGVRGAPGVCLMPRGRAEGIAKTLGWTKEETKQFLWENSIVPWSTIELTISAPKIAAAIKGAEAYYPLAEGEPWPICSKPDDIVIVVAGGAQSGHMYFMQGAFAKPPLIKEMKLPAKWDELLAQAEEDLGPIPA